MVYKLFFFPLIFSFVILNPNSLKAGKDHGDLAKEHVQEAENFINKYMKEDSLFSYDKVERFILKLEREREILKKDIYETKILEKLELDLKKYKKAKNKATEKSLADNSPALKAYDEYLIPKMKTLLQNIRDNSSKRDCEEIVDDFIRGYNPFFVPNAHRNLWPKDLDLTHNLKKMFITYKFKNNFEKIEAFNLRIETDNLSEIRSCLGTSLRSGDYLNQSQIRKLQNCNYDISKLNPGVSALWQKNSSEKINFIKKKNLNYFPPNKTKLHYGRIIYRGHQSPKIKIHYMDKGKKVSLKLKLGQEVHADIATSSILELIGFNQDKMLYKDKVKLYLGKTSYEEFKSDFINKYGLERFIRYVTAHGEDEDGEWLVFEDVLFETRKNNELRVGPFDISSWDLSNRREFRAQILAWGWLGITNTKLANFKFLFREDSEGLTPLMRFQDPSSSLGGSYHLKKIKNVLSFNKFSRVNVFSNSFIKRKDDTLKLEWNDLSQFKRYFSFTTWQDLKWMARKIASITKEDLYQSLSKSGMPKPVCELYYIKLINRRNEIIKVFDLEEEYQKIQVHDLKTFNMRDEKGEFIIEQGQLKQVSFPGKNVLYHVPEKWSTFLPKMLTFNIPITDWQDSKNQQKFDLSLAGLNGLKTELGVDDSEMPKAITTIPLGVGVQALLSRVVSPNEQYLNSNAQMRLYMIRDRMKIRFSLDSPFIREQIRKVKPLDFDLSLKFFEYEFEYIHYSDHVKKAYLSKFNLPSIVLKMRESAALKTKPLEIIKVYQKYGLDFSSELGVSSLKPVVRNQTSITAGANKILLHTFVRDQYGQLHVYSEKTKRKHLGASLNVMELSPFGSSLPLFKITAGKSTFRHIASDRFFNLAEKSKEQNESQLTDEERQSEFRALKKLKITDEKDYLLDPDLNNLKTNFKIDSFGSHSVKEFGAGFVFNNKQVHSSSHSQVTFASGEKKSFYRTMYIQTKSKGVTSGLLNTGHIFLANRDKVASILEMDQDQPQKAILIVRAEQYFQKRDRAGILEIINSQNKKFSKHEETLFFRNHHLPEADEVNKYKKIYALMRIFINAHVFFDNLKNVEISDLKPLLVKHFDLSKRKIKKVFKLLTKAKELTSGKKDASRYMKLSDLYIKIVKKLQVNRYGISFLKDFLGEDGLFVMGEIQGVIPSFSSLQDLQQPQRRRFMGESWGSYERVPPLQKLLRKKRLVVPSIYIDKTVSDNSIFGYLESCLAPNIEFLYDHETRF